MAKYFKVKRKTIFLPFVFLFRTIYRGCIPLALDRIPLSNLVGPTKALAKAERLPTKDMLIHINNVSPFYII